MTQSHVTLRLDGVCERNHVRHFWGGELNQIILMTHFGSGISEKLKRHLDYMCNETALAVTTSVYMQHPKIHMHTVDGWTHGQ